MKNFKYLSPETLDEALTLLNEFNADNNYLLAGGTDLLVRLKSKEINTDCIIDLRRVSSLDSIEYNNKFGLKIGALATISKIENY